MSEKIKIIKRGDRGFHGYGPEFVDSYGSRIEVYESSNAEGPHCWIKVDSRAWITGHNQDDFAVGTAHLTPEQAHALISRLETWLDEIPRRWGR